MNSQKIRELISELISTMIEREIEGNIFIVGGAAIALRNPERRNTNDVDVLVRPADAIFKISEEMAVKHEIDKDWLNDAVKGFVPFVGLEEWVPYHSEAGVEVYLGSIPMLLAMKLRANRSIRDAEDLEFLFDAFELKSVDDAQLVYEKYFAQEVISDSAVNRINNWLKSRITEN